MMSMKTSRAKECGDESVVEVVSKFPESPSVWCLADEAELLARLRTQYLSVQPHHPLAERSNHIAH